MSSFSRRVFLAGVGGSLFAARAARAQEKGVNKAPNVKTGVWPVMFTPFTESGEVDGPAVKEMTEFYVNVNVAGIFASALSGEIFNLSIDEALAIGRLTIEQAAGRAGVVVGANFGASLDEQAANIARMHEIGVDAAVIVLSKLPSREDIEGQLIELMERTKGPLGLYECPAPEHRQVSAETVRRLAETGRFYFIKETSRDPDACAAKVAAAKGTQLKVLNATPSALPRLLDLGVTGHCGTVANFAPELLSGYFAQPDPAERDRIFHSLEAISRAVCGKGYPSSGKYVLEKRGLHLTTVSRSMKPGAFTDEMRKQLDDFVAHFDFQRA